MKFAAKDIAGVVIALGTTATVVAHNLPGRHLDSHVPSVVDGGGAVTSAAPATTIAFVGVHVVSMSDDTVERGRTVLVEDGFVVAVGPSNELRPPAGSHVIDATGLYLAPGLTDAHVHLGESGEDVLPLFVANGVTTVFNLEGTDQHLELRERVLSGEIVGPTIYTAGPFIDGTVVRSEAEARRVVRRQRSDGYDFLKVHGDLAPDAYLALADASSQENIPILGHAQRDLPISTLFEAGQAGLSHAEDLIYTEFMSLNPAALGGVASRMAEAGTWLTPSLVNFESVAAQWGAPEGLEAALERQSARFLPPSMRRDWERSNEWIQQSPDGRSRLQDMLAFHGPLVRTFHEAGVPILAGTDAGMPGLVPGFSLQTEIEALREAGLTNHQAMAAATLNAGRFIRQHVDPSASFGEVAVGGRADLLLLSTDPRADLASLRSPVGVMVRGSYLDRAALDALLAGTDTVRR